MFLLRTLVFCCQLCDSKSDVRGLSGRSGLHWLEQVARVAVSCLLDCYTFDYVTCKEEAR